MFLLNSIISKKIYALTNNRFALLKPATSSDFSIEHCKVLTQWQFYTSYKNNFDPFKIQCYQMSKEVTYDVGIILELVTVNGIVLKRSKLTVVRANVLEAAEERTTLRCELSTQRSSIGNKYDGKGQLIGRVIIFTRDPEVPFKLLPGMSSMCNSFKNLFNDRESSADIVVKASDGVELKVHKLLLMTRSSTFKTMFAIDMTERQNGIVHIKDFNSQVLNELFRFIYYNEVEGIEEIVDGLLKAAKRYEVEELPEVCAKYIINNFEDQEIWNVLKLAHIYELQELLEFISSIFLANYKFYSQQEVWKKEHDVSLKSKVHECIVKFHQNYDNINNSGICKELDRS